MKKLYNIYFIVLALFFVACTENPLEDVEGTDWQKDRNVVSILVEGQIGTAIIERNFDDAKIKIYAKVENIADLANVEIKNIAFSYGASSANEKGTTLDLSSGTATIAVASGAGESLNWEVSLLPFKSDLEGTWYIGNVSMYCDMFTWESWGWEKYVQITDYLPELNPELDNEIIFTVEGADAKGNPYGNYEHNAGSDGLFGSYTDAAKGWDFNSRFRKIPTGNGTWLRDFERNKVIITDANKVEYELDLELLTETNEVTLKTEVPYLADNFSWTDTDWSYEELAHMSNSTWYTLTKERVLQTGNSITGLTVKDQDGDTQIDGDTKEITVTILDNGANLAAIELTGLDLSYAATADTSVGSTLDFSTANTTTINVTSETGESASWTVKILVKSDLDGTYSNPSSLIYVNQEYGSDYSKNISDDFTSANLEFDNEIVVVSEGYNGDRPNGKITNNAGADGVYGDYNHVDADVDLNAKLRHLLPAGESYFEIDLATNTMYVGTSKDDLTSEAKMLATDMGITLQFTLAYRELEPNWSYGNYDNYMCWTYQYEINLDKQ
ncbi:hypothetical protein I2486_10115 [Cellulophaga sp. E16_2]|uniref:hypothetical protein n=1 Tax=Cellulophaga sp. E16_2 TaxID=2789297 RepID=UPI001A91E52B|nr:hypothetical protein [Cellulophaga sp. E16_2]MBO0591761.1 hypothetical protein [Cellulophaga sp. E16_2]